MGTVEYRLGPRFLPVDMGEIGITWQVAEDYCVSQGGHLPSVTSNLEAGELYSELLENDEISLRRACIWLGGTNNEVAENWTWVDGTDWGYEDWNPGGFDAWHTKVGPEPNGGGNQCLYFWALNYNYEGSWYDQGLSLIHI